VSLSARVRNEALVNPACLPGTNPSAAPPFSSSPFCSDSLRLLRNPARRCRRGSAVHGGRTSEEEEEEVDGFWSWWCRLVVVECSRPTTRVHVSHIVTVHTPAGDRSECFNRCFGCFKTKSRKSSTVPYTVIIWLSSTCPIFHSQSFVFLHRLFPGLEHAMNTDSAYDSHYSSPAHSFSPGLNPSFSANLSHSQ